MDDGQRPRLSRRQIAGVVAGNGLEFYDFLTFSFFAAQIGRTLFPQDGGHGLAFALATFGVGFVTRPLGGLIIGRIADRRGRKPAMLLTFACMGVAIIGLALTPSYAAIGMAAPVLAVTFRMLQGFALGGEVGPNTAFLLEAAPEGRRALYVAFQYATQDAAVLLSGCVGLALSTALAPAQLDAWGWRVAFLIGATIVPFGLWIRRSLGETLHATAAAEVGEATARGYGVIAAGGLLVLAAGTIANYTLDYLTTYAQDTLKMRVETAFLATIVLGMTNVVVGLLSGLLADRFGRKRVLLLPWLLIIVAIVPAFSVISAYRTGAALLSMTALLAVLLSMCSGPALVLFSEAVPARVRAGSIGLVYAVAIAIFGGSAQVVDHQLIAWTGNPVAPAWYTLAALVVGLIGVALIPERKPPLKAVELRAVVAAVLPA